MPSLPFKRTQSAQEAAQKKRNDIIKKKEEEEKAKETQRQLETTHPSARYAPTQVFFADPTFAEPPSLNYTLKTRYRALWLFWTLIFLDCVCMPIILYFCLWYLTSLSHNAGEPGLEHLVKNQRLTRNL